MANDYFAIKFPDLSELLESMEGLSRSVKGRIARRATAAGARVIRDQIRENASRVNDPTTKNNIARNVRVKWDRRLAKSEKGAAYKIGILGGGKSRKENEQNPGGDTYYWRFLEFGTVHMPARPIVMPAINEKREESLRVAINLALNMLQEENKKA